MCKQCVNNENSNNCLKDEKTSSLQDYEMYLPVKNETLFITVG